MVSSRWYLDEVFFAMNELVVCLKGIIVVLDCCDEVIHDFLEELVLLEGFYIHLELVPDLFHRTTTQEGYIIEDALELLFLLLHSFFHQLDHFLALLCRLRLSLFHYKVGLQYTSSVMYSRVMFLCAGFEPIPRRINLGMYLIAWDHSQPSYFFASLP